MGAKIFALTRLVGKGLLVVDLAAKRWEQVMSYRLMKSHDQHYQSHRWYLQSFRYYVCS